MTASERPAEQRADIDGQGNVTVQIVGDKNRVTVGSAAALRLSMFARKRTELGDMGLLSAFTQSIALVGRESEMAEVRTWLASARDIAIQVWIGSAGAGKTRLAFDLCDQLDKAGAWQAGFVDGDQLAGLITDAGARWGWDRPTLAVVDYAAEWADVVRRWFGQLGVFAPTDGPPLRILLLERQADPQKGWLQMALGLGDSQSRTVRAMLDPSDPLLLSRLMNSDHRRAILNEMFERMRLPIRTPSAGSAPHFDRRLQELSWGGEPLFLMMAALLAAEASLPQVLALPRTEIAHKVAEREIGRVHRLAKKQGLDADLLVHMAAYVTLCQGLDRSSLLDAIETEADALKRTITGGAATVADALADALPGTPSAPEPIRPDAVGEAVLLRALGDPRIDGAAVVTRAFALAGKQVAASVLRTAQDFAAEGHDQPLLWLNALIRQASDDTDMLFNLAGQIPASSLALAGVAAQIYTEIAGNLRDIINESGQAIDLAVLTVALNNVSNRLANLGQYDVAKEAAEEAVQARQLLLEQAVDKSYFSVSLASSLITLAVIHYKFQQYELAIKPINRAVRILETIPFKRDEYLCFELAQALTAKSNILSRLNLGIEATADARRCLSIWRFLDGQYENKGKYHHHYAIALTNLSSRYIDLKKDRKALPLARKAVKFIEELAASEPDSFLHPLALCLMNLANCLYGLDRPEEARRYAKDGVQKYQYIVHRMPSLSQEFGFALATLANCEDKCWNAEAALSANHKAIDVYSKLFFRNSSACLEHMRSMVEQYRRRCARLRRQPDARLLTPILTVIRQMQD